MLVAIDQSGFAEALRAADDVANLAPSSHNSQPWALAIASADRAVVCLDTERQLRALPAHALEMMLSCGMYRELLIQAMSARGWACTRAEPPDDLSAPQHLVPLSELRFEPAAAGPDVEAVAKARRTNRAPYAPEPLSAATLEQLAAPNVRLVVDPPAIRAIGRFVGEHAAIDFEHDAAWRETHAFIRHTDDAEDGFPLSQLFGPLSAAKSALYRIALAPATMSLLKHAGYARSIAKQLGALVAETPALVWFAFDDAAPDAETQLDGGAQVMRFWLDVTRLGLALHPVSVVLQHDAIRTRLEETHGLPARGFFFARLGRPTTIFPPAPRRRNRRLHEL